MRRIVAIGEALIDFLEREKGADGYPVLAAQPGGAPANYLAAAVRAGVGAAMIAKVGEDAFGRLLTDTMAAAGIDVTGVVWDSGCFTTLAFVTLDETGDRHFSFARKPGADLCLTPEEVPLSLIDGADVFHFGTLSLTAEPARSATRLAVTYAQEQGRLISFDPNLRPPLWETEHAARGQILWGLQQADVVKISEEEMEFALGCGPEEGARRLLTEFDCRLVFVTRGRAGCYCANGRGQGYVPGFSVDTVDTTGAGDIFGGSAMARMLLTGKAPEELEWAELEAVARYANAAAALSTRVHGGLGSVPDPEQVLALLG